MKFLYFWTKLLTGVKARTKAGWFSTVNRKTGFAGQLGWRCSPKEGCHNAVRNNVLLRAPTGVDIGERYAATLAFSASVHGDNLKDRFADTEVADEKILCDCLHHLLVDQQGWLGMADIKRLFRSLLLKMTPAPSKPRHMLT